jgi:hypothetical protein
MDFVKEHLGVAVQFGKYAFMVYNVCAKMTIFIASASSLRVPVAGDISPHGWPSTRSVGPRGRGRIL